MPTSWPAAEKKILRLCVVVGVLFLLGIASVALDSSGDSRRIVPGQRNKHAAALARDKAMRSIMIEAAVNEATATKALSRIDAAASRKNLPLGHARSAGLILIYSEVPWPLATGPALTAVLDAVAAAGLPRRDLSYSVFADLLVVNVRRYHTRMLVIEFGMWGDRPQEPMNAGLTAANFTRVARLMARQLAASRQPWPTDRQALHDAIWQRTKITMFPRK